jgi:phosphoribosylanthranilate isomerase
MSVWTKICGNTSLADAQLSVDAGADAVGFVFAPSPRRVTAGEAAAIVALLPQEVEKIGVFVDAGIDEIYATVRAAGLTGVQLHFDPAPGLPGKLRQLLGARFRILQVVHFEAGGGDVTASRLTQCRADSNLDGVLVDSRTASAAGGTGVAFDWAEARRTVFDQAGDMKLIAAGGLNATNVAAAITILRPWGVDVVSGVESAPGRKDARKLRDFLAQVRGCAG